MKTSTLSPLRRRLSALVASTVGLLVGAGCAISPASYEKGQYRCFLEVGPLSGHPTAPDAIFPIIGELLYESCWLVD
ncbi:MAG TPA: hypothetical protein PLV93_07760 [Microthrixaceae bacterium]|nr:hypothetical protein [Microthrixaceae bacterium]HNI35280.1 hypothetical protein [Microthrixaceae bacterium]